MASLVATNSYLWVNGIDISSYAKSVTLNRGSEAQDATTFGQTTRIVRGGLKTWSIAANFLWDASTGGPEATLWALVGTTSCVEYRNVNVCSTVTNPSYFGVVTLDSLPTASAIGAMLSMTANFANSGTLSRASSS